MLTFLASVAGIYGCFLTWGVLQERVSTTPYGEEEDRFRHFIFLNFLQALTAAVAGRLYLAATGRSAELPRGDLLKEYVKVAVTNAAASPFGYASVQYISYPTMILGKCCKLVPVMLMNFILYRRHFPLYKYVCVALVTAGVSSFMLMKPGQSGKSEGSSSSLLGLTLLTINLLLDGATNSTQDRIFHRFRVSGQHMMLYMNLFSALGMFLYMLLPITDALPASLAFLSRHPEAIQEMGLFSVAGAIGQCFIFFTLERYGSLSLVTITVTRKIFTMLLSVFWFNHSLASGQWAGVALVFSGIGLEAFFKFQDSRSKSSTQNKVKKQ
ncbi:UAA transporter [Piptocephalis cylindrospora]|uniref:UDP-galactose transporter homolog 1 n=1 Tax=Piptocephalis cylindrospora TaxID=1907219 RepID=A0A4P9Y3R0_9FUNG|nr:UAA transporter [Piptocephalis cylindrospora]|eukprot:RKP13576.1 UAA transporter [Piptocephalis cylindrospora]